MQLSAVEDALLRVGKAPNRALKFYDEGFYLTQITSRPLADLEQQVCADRLLLAEQFIGTGDKLTRTRPPQYRSAISRYYYSMYHSIRAVVYFENRGDDFQEHSKLPVKLPTAFPNAALWQNCLKDARGHRNDADYDPYPMTLTVWRDDAKLLGSQARQLLGIARQYLRQKGCGYV